MLWPNFNSVSVAARNEEHISGDTTPIKNTVLMAIDKLVSLSPLSMKPHLISPAKQPVVSSVKETAPVSLSQVSACSVTYSLGKRDSKRILAQTPSCFLL